MKRNAETIRKERDTVRSILSRGKLKIKFLIEPENSEKKGKQLDIEPELYDILSNTAKEYYNEKLKKLNSEVNEI